MRQLLTILITSLTVLLSSFPACSSDTSQPTIIVSRFIEAVQKNDIDSIHKYGELQSIQNQPRHSYTLIQLQKILTPINLAEIRYSKPVFNTGKKTWLLRTVGTIRLDFELKRKRQPHNKEEGLIIIAIHP